MKMKMKAGRYDPSRNTSSQHMDDQYMDGQYMGDQHMDDDQDVPQRFQDLGFEEGEWEMFVSDFPNYDPDQLVQQYLEISRASPFNTSWNNEQDAVNADYRITDRLTKHDIAKDVLDLYWHPSEEIDSNSMAMEVEGGKRKRRNKTKKSRKSKKSRKNTRRRRSMRRH
jgi:hypothetical protein